MKVLPIPARRSLCKLGADINECRRRRRITAQMLADRCGISRVSLAKIEKGDPGVSAGLYAAVLFSLGFDRALGDVADVRNDPLGLQALAVSLPQRVRGRRDG